MEKKLVDANVVLRYLLRDDEELFKLSFDLLENVKIGKEIIEITESVLAECVYVLLKLYGIDRITIAEKLGELFSYKGIGNPDKDDLVEAIKMFGQTQLSIVDCILCAKAVNRGMVLFTFDEELDSVYKKKSPNPSKMTAPFSFSLFSVCPAGLSEAGEKEHCLSQSTQRPQREKRF